MTAAGGVQPRLHALVPCAGTGRRAGVGLPKQYRQVAGQPLVMHTLAALRRVARLARLLVVVAPGDQRLAPRAGAWQVLDQGGASRAETVCAGLVHLQRTGASADDWVLVHDAARCLVAAADVDALIDACLDDAVGGLLAVPLAATLKQAVGGRVAATLDRSDKWLAQTPQMFRLGPLHAALERQRAQAFAGITDEASAMEAAGHRPLLVPGHWQNIKVTYPQDFAFAERLLQERCP